MKRTLPLIAIGLSLVSSAAFAAGPMELAPHHRVRVTSRLVVQKTERLVANVTRDPYNAAWRRAAAVSAVGLLRHAALRLERATAGYNPVRLRLAVHKFQRQLAEAHNALRFLHHSAFSASLLAEVQGLFADLRVNANRWIAAHAPIPPAPSMAPLPPPPAPPAPAPTAYVTTPGASVTVYRTF